MQASDTLSHILNKFNFSTLESDYKDAKMPIQLPRFGRNNLAELFDELEFKLGVEVGVESGDYSEVLLKENPNLTLYSIDAWQSHREYRDHTRQEKFDQFFENTKKKLAPFGQRSVIVKSFSMEAVKMIKDRTLDFVYIDANHKFVEFANDLHWWSKKVRVGGIVAGHDYTRYKDLDVEIHIPYVLEGFVNAYQIKPHFVIGEDVDNVKSWFFVQTLP